MFYVIADTLLKVVNMFYAIANIVEMALNTNKTDHYVLHYTWHIVEKWH